MQADPSTRTMKRIRRALLLGGAIAMVGPSAQAGSPLTLAILQDASVTASRLDLRYIRRVKCSSPDFPPDVRVVTEKGTLSLAAKKSFYISELKIADPSQHVCFFPAETVTMTTGVDFTTTQELPARTYDQVSQELDVLRIDATVGKVGARVGAACTGSSKLDTDENRMVLRVRQSQILSSKAGTKKGGAAKGDAKGAVDADVVLDCEVTPQP
jgi:hypothetical protein